ncbi:unnamed protein product, partial [Acanthoscelides obtectus]
TVARIRVTSTIFVFTRLLGRQQRAYGDSSDVIRIVRTCSAVARHCQPAIRKQKLYFMCAAPKAFTQFKMGSERRSSENNITFMNLYREPENLWNCFDKNHKNRDIRKASLQYIANEMSLVNTNEVTQKIKKL